MPFARGDMGDHIVSHKNDHGASYRRYAVLQWWSRLKICFREIFGIVRFSTFATKSPRERTSSGCLGRSEKCQQETHASQQIRGISTGYVVRSMRSSISLRKMQHDRAAAH